MPHNPISPLDLPIETIAVGTKRVACSGGPGGKGGPLGHPKVYLTMAQNTNQVPGQVRCPYCGRLYVYDAALADKHGH